MAARVKISRHEQGWSMLCNGVVLFDDAGGLLPDGTEVGSGQEAAVPRQRARGVYVPSGWVLAAGARSLGSLGSAGIL
jgi:Family of unknown function (DUF5999)